MPEREFTIVDPGRVSVLRLFPVVQAKAKLGRRKLWSNDSSLSYVANPPLERTEKAEGTHSNLVR